MVKSVCEINNEAQKQTKVANPEYACVKLIPEKTSFTDLHLDTNCPTKTWS